MLSDDGLKKYEKLRQAYQLSLNNKRDNLLSCWQTVISSHWSKESLLDLHQRIHHLAGSASPYGFSELSDRAQQLERQLLYHIDSTSPSSPDLNAISEISELFHALINQLQKNLMVNNL